MKRLGFGVATLLIVEPRQTVETGGGLGVIGPQCFLPYREGALQERLGFGVATFG